MAYKGINAHLNSYLQQRAGGWESFHATHIIRVWESLDQSLPKNYYTLAEKSLQISEVGDDKPKRTTRPDVGVYQATPSDEAVAVATDAKTPTLTLPLFDPTTEVDDYMTAIGIYKIDSGELPGKLVTRLEVLSPANKRGGSYAHYAQKRLQTLQSGINLVELDYLHETPSIDNRVPSYPDRQENATPYYALVSYPQPDFENGTMLLYSMAINEALPIIPIPLVGEDAAALALQDTYAATIQARAFQLMIDLTNPPKNMDAYTEADQQYIREVMATAPQSD